MHHRIDRYSFRTGWGQIATIVGLSPNIILSVKIISCGWKLLYTDRPLLKAKSAVGDVI
jgi:hypothetical protein